MTSKQNNFGTGVVLFERLSRDPFLSAQAGTLYADGATTADVLEFRQEVLLFFGGLSATHERIGLAVTGKDSFDGRRWTRWFPEPIVDIGGPYDFDALHVTDPASAIVDDKIYLYYSGIGGGTDGIGLAISTDGRVFEKLSSNPLMEGRAPEIVAHNGRFYLFFVRENGKGGYSIHLAVSEDGIHFPETESRVVLWPATGSWDGHSVTTPRILKTGGRFMMIYAGDDLTKDEPKHFGLALSENLQSWSKYPGNPVFTRGLKGWWDEEAIWFGTPYIHRGQIYMLYEGCRRRSSDGLPVSQIGLAEMTEENEGPLRQGREKRRQQAAGDQQQAEAEV